MSSDTTGRVRAAGTVTASAAATGALLAILMIVIAGSTNTVWLIARAGGITAFVLLTAVVAFGLLMATPRSGKSWVGVLVKLRAHIVLAAFTIAFTITHAVAIAIDPYVNVGWVGALVPGMSEWRTLPVAAGVVAAWLLIIVAITAGLAGRVGGTAWLNIHRLAIIVWCAAWAHSVFTGTDTPALLALYAGTAVLLAGLAVRRYVKAGWR